MAGRAWAILLFSSTLASACSPAWRPVTLKQAGFSVEMPGNPKRDTGPITEMPLSGDWDSYAVSTGTSFWNRGPIVAYLIGTGRLKAGSAAEEALDRSVAWTLASGQRLVSRAKIPFPGGIAEEALFESSHEVMTRQRTVVVGDRVVQLMVIGTREEVYSGSLGDRFIRSFKIEP